MALVTIKVAVAISLLFAFTTFVSVVVSQTPYRQLHYPPGTPGGFSVAAAPGGLIFVSTVDGLILLYRPSDGWTTFAYVTPGRINATAFCQNITETTGRVCGYPLGLVYDGSTGQLYIAEGFRGLMTAGPQSGTLASPIATAANNTIRFNATVGVDMNPLTRIIYFTDTSTNYEIGQWWQAIGAGDRSGRLLQYNINTRQVTVLRSGLGYPTGVALSADGSFVLYSETSLNRTTRYYLTGPRANTTEPFISNIVRPVSIRRTTQGEFMIAASMVDLASGTAIPVAVRADATGRVVETTPLYEQFGDLLVTEVYQFFRNDTFITSSYAPYLVIYEGHI